MMGHSVSGRATRTLYSHLLTPHHLLPHTRLAKPLLSRQEWNPTPRHSLLGADVQAECFFCRGRSRLPLSPGSLAAHARVSSFTLCNSLPLFLSLPISFLSNDPVQFLNIADLPFDMNPNGINKMVKVHTRACMHPFVSSTLATKSTCHQRWRSGMRGETSFLRLVVARRFHLTC